MINYEITIVQLTDNTLYSMWLSQKQAFDLQKNVAFVNGRIRVSIVQSMILCSAGFFLFAKWKIQLSLLCHFTSLVRAVPQPAYHAPYITCVLNVLCRHVGHTMYSTCRLNVPMSCMHATTDATDMHPWTDLYSTFDTSSIIPVFSTWPYHGCANRSYMSREAISHFRRVETACWLPVARTGLYPEGTNGW